ncbi:hypothetical protein IGI37_003340 [Enterococcus sp. AZ194]|uniref:hypothetical protein n=1 Tax=Enterococcus sp. AZ194 TaxID=2774629 RepID=UPI003F279468
MSIIDWLFIACISISILSGVFGVVMFIQSFRTSSQLKQLKEMTPPKLKKKKRLWMRKIKLLTLTVKKQRKRTLLSFLIGIILVAGGFYGRNYQATTISKEDSAAYVTGNFLTTEMQGQLALITEDPGRARTNITELSGRMASFGIKRADGRLNIEGQRILNRYYKQMKEFGLNIAGQMEQVLTEEEVRTNYENDLATIIETQKKVAEFYELKEDTSSPKK